MESMSSAPYLLPKARFGFRMGDVKALDAMVHDGLTNPFSGRQMFDEATEIGDELEISRPDLDRWALRSHELAIEATDSGRLPEEIVSVTIKGREGRHRRRGRRGAAPRQRRWSRSPSCPASSAKTGSHTAGNSPGVNDGGGRDRRSPPTSGRRPTARRCCRRSSPRRRSPTTSPTSPARPRGRREGAREGGPDRSTTSTYGRSTRRSLRSR